MIRDVVACNLLSGTGYHHHSVGKGKEVLQLLRADGKRTTQSESIWFFHQLPFSHNLVEGMVRRESEGLSGRSSFTNLDKCSVHASQILVSPTD
jgi:hypothetical protein